MRTLVSSLALFVVVALSTAADDPPADKKTPPAGKDDASTKTEDAPLTVGNPLPGAFQPYNVTGPYKQRFHCLISEHHLDPMVMIFYKNVDFSDPLPNLLKRLEAAIEKNPSARLGCFVVFLPDDLPDVAGSNDKSEETNSKNDDARIELEKKIEEKGSDLKLKHVVLCLDSKTDVEKFALSDSDLVTVVLYKKLKVAAVHHLPKSDFTDAAVEKIMADVAGELGAKRK
jgi:hypothetical protein